MKIQIEPRYVREEGDLRVFQRETLEAIKDSSVKVIEVEVPVGKIGFKTPGNFTEICIQCFMYNFFLYKLW